MARTYNRRPVLQNGPDDEDIKNYTFSFDSWKGICDTKDFLAVDQSTFSDASNMYIDSEGLLSSRPALHRDTDLIAKMSSPNMISYFEYKNDIKSSTICVALESAKIRIVDGDTAVALSASSGEDFSTTKFFDTYDKLFIFKSGDWVYYDKTVRSFRTSIDDSIYVPITKTFTGSTESEGEQPNILTTAERWLYYYNDTTGIHSSAIGKTLTFDDKTITWGSKTVAQLTKEHYKIGISDPVSISPAGTVAWVSNSALNYAANGAIIHSWDISGIVSSGHSVKQISFNQTSDLIIVDIYNTSDTVQTYIVSCLSTSEDGTFKYSSPTDIHDALSIPSDCDIISHCIIDDEMFAVIGKDSSETTYPLYVNFDGSGLLKATLSSTAVTPLRVAMNASYVTLLYGRTGSTTTTDAYVVAVYSKIDSDLDFRYNIQYDRPSGTLSFNPSHCALSVDTYNYYLCVPCDKTTSSGLTKYTYYATRRALNDPETTVPILQITGSIPAVSPIIAYDNKNVIALPNFSSTTSTVYDISLVDFKESDSSGISNVTFTGRILPFTSDCYNYYTTPTSSEKLIFTRFSTDTFELYYTKSGTNKFFEPTDVLFLNSYYFANGNYLYISEARYNDDEEFQFYLPKKNENRFENVITKLHQISEQIIAIFFENEIYYSQYDSDAGTYLYYKSKLQYGLKAGNDVLTADDSVTTLFATSRGIMALTYQDFVSATEQKTSPISDSVYNEMKPLLSNTMKMFKYDFWIIMYCLLEDVAWVYDTRNGSWWKEVISHPVMFIGKKNDKPLVLIQSKPYQFSTSDEDYHDQIDSNNDTIEWEFTTQKLHLKSPEYFKSIQSMTFFGVTDSDSEYLFNTDVVSYRSDLYKNEFKNVQYACKLIRTFTYRTHIMKINEIQVRCYCDDTINQPDMIKPIKLSSIAIKYRITRQVR